MTFDACRTAGSSTLGDRPDLVVAGCETHVCVLQTVLGLIEAGGGSISCAMRSARAVREQGDRDRRMAHHGAEIVTTEMVVFEWLGTRTTRAHDDLIK